jgi:hypothetical protein
MNVKNFDSFRIYVLLMHLVSITFLIWTRYPSVQVTLGPNYSSGDYKFREDSYLGLIAWGIMLVLFQLSILPFSIGKLSFRSVFNMALDISAIFFNFWIALDALGWDTYIYIFVFCVYVFLIFICPFLLIFSN